jgi:hypothetical protein
MTGLDTQLDILISLMNPTFSKQLSLATIALRFGSSNLRRCCFIGHALGSTFNACSMSSLGMLGMSYGHHAKISQCSQRNSMSAPSYAGSKSTTMDVVLSRSVPLNPVLYRKPGPAGINRCWVPHYDQCCLLVLHIPLSY